MGSNTHNPRLWAQRILLCSGNQSLVAEGATTHNPSLRNAGEEPPHWLPHGFPVCCSSSLMGVWPDSGVWPDCGVWPGCGVCANLWYTLNIKITETGQTSLLSTKDSCVCVCVCVCM